MFRNYLKTAWRNVMKSKAFSLINLLGLTIGITVCMMIFLFIMNEWSVDRFHANGDRIYRVMRGFKKEGKQGEVAYLSSPYAAALVNDFSGEIVNAVRIQPADNLVSIGNSSFHESNVYDVDADFFNVFSFPLLIGDEATVLKDPGSVVLTRSTAKKYFNSPEQAMGQTIIVDKELPLKVTGIAEDVTANSHLYFDLLVPLSNYERAAVTENWMRNSLYTYVLLDSATSAAQIETRLPTFMEKYLGSDMRKFGFHWTLSLTPLQQVYFDKEAFDNTRHGDKTVVYIFLSIAVLILLIACINFMNLSTIRAVDRAKEVGIRKVMGALRVNLTWQFIGESVLLTAVACLLSVGLLLLLMPAYNLLLDYSLTISWGTMPIYLFLLGTILFVGLLAGSYPAFFLSAFSPIQALKGKLTLGKGGSTFRQTLVVVQFSISVFLIVGTLIISKQMSYIKNKQLGYEQEQTLLVPIDNQEIYDHLQLFKTSLENSSVVQQVSLMSGEPGGYFDSNVFEVEDHAEKWDARTEFADFEFVKTLGLNVIAGRDLSAAFPTDTTDAVLINRTAAANLGWTPSQAIGKWIRNTVRDDSRRQIVGVIEDFNFQSLKQLVQPLVIAPNEDRRMILVKLTAGNLQAGIDAVSHAYKNVASAYPFEYRFLDEQFSELYKKDIRQQRILSIFALLAIFVACLGLFGLASFTATKRSKEIGVRKVLGSSVREIVFLLSRDLLKPVIIASCITLPVAYWAMSAWLENFAYKTALSWWIFFLAALLSFGIALITVCMKAIRAAQIDPVKSIRAD